jgi:hypothetical protein
VGWPLGEGWQQGEALTKMKEDLAKLRHQHNLSKGPRLHNPLVRFRPGSKGHLYGSCRRYGAIRPSDLRISGLPLGDTTGGRAIVAESVFAKINERALTVRADGNAQCEVSAVLR